MQRPEMRLSGPCVEAPDVPELVRFYERFLGWEVDELVGPREDRYKAKNFVDAWNYNASLNKLQANTRRMIAHYNAQVDAFHAAYPDLSSIPGGVDAVVIGTKPERAVGTLEECDRLGIKHVWMHRSFGKGSVSDEATEYGRDHGIEVIDGGCPCMFDPTADPGHKVMRFVCTLSGTVPRKV
jgi:catechol 2,3-dioxygenase-like lactoylglutathione lyase family enzyme